MRTGREPVSIAFGVKGGRIYLRFPHNDEEGEWNNSENFMDVEIAHRLLIELLHCIADAPLTPQYKKAADDLAAVCLEIADQCCGCSTEDDCIHDRARKALNQWGGQ